MEKKASKGQGMTEKRSFWRFGRRPDEIYNWLSVLPDPEAK
jgi:hypothetical protein